ncbi:hypothetical protein Cgig2_003222 [Carnegiea gigantea]|uniref:Membrane-associated kinase regulator 4 n=1 Tax=Carnegiea gigantea TaxID=171969 RepID=A0A9Q1JTU3_9CARY|nr:hypothetical protein Cgig2_012613 [Carnegiea gigantea]KAJ8430943.1 hypothetical protein Cgig2_003222 [Carnegiea gigantea]
MAYHHDQQRMTLKEEEEEDDYIDMEVNSFTHFPPLPRSTTATSSPPHHPPVEFEFQTKSSSNAARELSTVSPADELFYKGKLLPLFLPSRLLMFEQLSSNFTSSTLITPLESCNISPVESCQVSQELCPDDYFRDYFAHQDDRKGGLFDSYDNDSNLKRSWTRKMKTKIKALFGKSLVAGCSVQSSVLIKNEESEHLKKQIKGTQKNPFGKNEAKNDHIHSSIFCHRRSFSGAFKRRTFMKKLSSSSSTSSSSSSNSVGLNDSELLKRSSSANMDVEGSLIQAAIAHCKESQQEFRSQNTLREVGIHSLDSSRIK